MGSNPVSAQPVFAVGNITPVFSPVKMKVADPPPTGVVSSPFLPHAVSSPPPASSAPGPGQESVIDMEASVDIKQLESFGFQPNSDQLESSASQPSHRGLFHHWETCTRTDPRTRNQLLAHRTGNR